MLIRSTLSFGQLTNKNNLELILLDSISGKMDDSAPCINLKTNMLYFSKLSEKGDKDVWFSEWINNQWAKPKAIHSFINNVYDNEIYHFDSLENTIYFQKALLSENGNEVTFGIFKAYCSGTDFSAPVKQTIDYFKNKSEDQSFCLNANSDVMILSAQNFFSYGVEDLYVSFKVADNNWSEPKNLGSIINTPYEEFTPFLDKDNRSLYFSSNGHKNGYGSKDIWVSYRLDETWTSWSTPLNLGPQINTIGMEKSFRKTNLKNIPYLVISSRTSNGQADIFGIKTKDNYFDSLIETIKPIEISTPAIEDSLFVSENQANSDSTIEKTIPDSALDLIDTTAKPIDDRSNILLISSFNKESGNTIPFTIEFTQGDSIQVLTILKDSIAKLTINWSDTVNLVVNSADFLPQSRKVIFENKHFGIQLREEFYLDSLEIGKSIKLEHVLFKRGTPELLEESNSDLDYVAEILKENSELQIEISGHTDNSGNAYLNQLLSEKRANSIKKYLVIKGIEPFRIKTIGHGGTKPIASNNSEETMKLNRRVEFRLLKIK